MSQHLDERAMSHVSSHFDELPLNLPVCCPRDWNSDLEVRPSLIANAGLGLFTKVHIPKHTAFCEYTGTELTLRQTMQLRDKTYLMGGFGLNCHIDANHHPDVKARYINDGIRSDKQNARFVKHKALKKASVVSTRDINPGDEIYASYGEVYWRYRPFTVDDLEMEQPKEHATRRGEQQSKVESKA